MKTLFSTLIVLLASMALAADPTTVNFNLVQVNQYPGQSEQTSNITTPGRRIVVDMSSPEASLQFLAATASIPVRIAKPSARKVAIIEGDYFTIPWESEMIVYTPSRNDSFLVTSSRTGCPGTEVGPCVAVAFPTGRGWSDPPIRFGPLTSKTTCPLGKGCELEVNGKGPSAPAIRILEESAMYGRR